MPRSAASFSTCSKRSWNLRWRVQRERRVHLRLSAQIYAREEQIAEFFRYPFMRVVAERR